MRRNIKDKRSEQTREEKINSKQKKPRGKEMKARSEKRKQIIETDRRRESRVFELVSVFSHLLSVFFSLQHGFLPSTLCSVLLYIHLPQHLSLCLILLPVQYVNYCCGRTES